MKRKFTALQDAILVEAAVKYSKCWIQVKDRVYGKTAEECRKRYEELEREGKAVPLPIGVNPEYKNFRRNNVGQRQDGSSECRNAPRETSSYNNQENGSLRNVKVNRSPSKMQWLVRSKLAGVDAAFVDNHAETESNRKRAFRTLEPKSDNSIMPGQPSLNASAGPKSMSSRGNLYPKFTRDNTTDINTNCGKHTRTNFQSRYANSSPIKVPAYSPFVANPSSKIQPTYLPQSSPVRINNPQADSNMLTPTVNISTSAGSLDFEDLFNFNGASDEPGPSANNGIEDTEDLFAEFNTIVPNANEIMEPPNPLIYRNFSSEIFDVPLTQGFRTNMGFEDLTSDNLFEDTGPPADADLLEEFFTFGDNDHNLKDDSDVENSMIPIHIPREEVDNLFSENVEDRRISEKFAQQSNRDSINWAVTPQEGFSLQQLELLKNQIKQSVQLVFQGYVIDKLISKDLKEKGNFWEEQLNEIQVRRQESVKVMGARSVFNIPEIDRIPEIRARTLTPHAKFSTQYSYKNGTKLVSLPAAGRLALDSLNCRFDQDLIPLIIPHKRTGNFLPEEEALLFQGLIQFGFNDLVSIKYHCLPSKTLIEIEKRLKTVLSRNQAANPMKDFALLPFKPMTVNEKHILSQAINKYGPFTEQVAQKIFPHIPRPLLMCAWNELYRIGAIQLEWKESPPYTSSYPIINSNIITNERKSDSLISNNPQFFQRVNDDFEQSSPFAFNGQNLSEFDSDGSYHEEKLPLGSDSPNCELNFFAETSNPNDSTCGYVELPEFATPDPKPLLLDDHHDKTSRTGRRRKTKTPKMSTPTQKHTPINKRTMYLDGISNRSQYSGSSFKSSEAQTPGTELETEVDTPVPSGGIEEQIGTGIQDNGRKKSKPKKLIDRNQKHTPIIKRSKTIVNYLSSRSPKKSPFNRKLGPYESPKKTPLRQFFPETIPKFDSPIPKPSPMAEVDALYINDVSDYEEIKEFQNNENYSPHSEQSNIMKKNRVVGRNGQGKIRKKRYKPNREIIRPDDSPKLDIGKMDTSKSIFDSQPRADRIDHIYSKLYGQRNKRRSSKRLKSHDIIN